MEPSTVNLMQQRFVQTGKAIDVSDFKELCFRITEIFISERSECKSAVGSISSFKNIYICKTCCHDHEGIFVCKDQSCQCKECHPNFEAAKPRFSTAEIKRKLPIRFSYDEVTLALTELVRIRALDEHVIKGKLFYSRR